jgi:hypothetical protein
MSEPEDDATMPEDAVATAQDEPHGAERLATLGEVLESSHERFRARVRERQRKGEIE